MRLHKQKHIRRSQRSLPQEIILFKLNQVYMHRKSFKDDTPEIQSKHRWAETLFTNDGPVLREE